MVPSTLVLRHRSIFHPRDKLSWKTSDLWSLLSMLLNCIPNKQFIFKLAIYPISFTSFPSWEVFEVKFLPVLLHVFFFIFNRSYIFILCYSHHWLPLSFFSVICFSKLFLQPLIGFENVFWFLVGRQSLLLGKPVSLSIVDGWSGEWEAWLVMVLFPSLVQEFWRRVSTGLGFIIRATTEQPIPTLYSRQQHTSEPTCTSFQLVPLLCQHGHLCVTIA